MCIWVFKKSVNGNQTSLLDVRVCQCMCACACAHACMCRYVCVCVYNLFSSAKLFVTSKESPSFRKVSNRVCKTKYSISVHINSNIVDSTRALPSQTGYCHRGEDAAFINLWSEQIQILFSVTIWSITEDKREARIVYSHAVYSTNRFFCVKSERCCIREYCRQEDPCVCVAVAVCLPVCVCVCEDWYVYPNERPRLTHTHTHKLWQSVVKTRASFL